MVSGGKTIVWDRRTDAGMQVAPGQYRFDVVARQSYRDDPVIAQTTLSLPLYYHDNCGSDNAGDDTHIVQGTPVRWGTEPSHSADEHPSSVTFGFTGLDASGEYALAAEFVANDDTPRLQDMTVDGVQVQGAASVSRTPLYLEYVKVPQEAIADGEITVSVNARGLGSAMVSQLWLKETSGRFSAQQITDVIPTAYRLEQNYPNPFNPTTTIRYALPMDGRVSLRVYDIAGREVATLVDDHKRAGSYEVRFNANSGKPLASGVYFYRLRTQPTHGGKAGEFVQTKKLLLLK
jgi:hypothetical protein